MMALILRMTFLCIKMASINQDKCIDIIIARFPVFSLLPLFLLHHSF